MSESEKNSGEANLVRDPFQDEIDNLVREKTRIPSRYSDPIGTTGLGRHRSQFAPFIRARLR